MSLEKRITEYLELGGLFNPELADHSAVRDLLIDCRKELAKPSDDMKDVAKKIGQFYLKKNEGDYKKTAEELLHLCISKIEVENPPIFAAEASKVVRITTARPGLLIGKRGLVVEALQEHLNMEVRVIEESHSLLDLMTPVQYEEEIDWVEVSRSLHEGRG